MMKYLVQLFKPRELRRETAFRRRVDDEHDFALETCEIEIAALFYARLLVSPVFPALCSA
jgi:hypothetical protein